MINFTMCNMSYANLFGHSDYDEIIKLKSEISNLEHEIVNVVFFTKK